MFELLRRGLRNRSFPLEPAITTDSNRSHMKKKSHDITKGELSAESQERRLRNYDPAKQPCKQGNGAVRIFRIKIKRGSRRRKCFRVARSSRETFWKIFHGRDGNNSLDNNNGGGGDQGRR